MTLHLDETKTGAFGLPGNQDVWVIVRCYNEASVVGEVIRGLKTVFPNVVGVDDGSVDTSSDAMARAGANVVRHAVNLGAGAALQTGLQYALLDHSAQYFVCFDADGQHRVEDAAAMIDRIRVEKMDILIGSRFLGRAENIPSSRKLLLKAGRVFERLTSKIDLTDAHNGLRIFSRAFASQVDLSMSDMAYASELLALISRSGLNYAEHPVTIDYTEYSMHKGQRSINSVNIAMDIWMNQMLRGPAPMTWIKVLLVLCFLGLLGWGFRHRAHVGLRAGMRLAAIALTGAAIAAIIQPDLLTRVANVVGVTRGTDLVLYVFIVIFIATSIGTYFRFREQDRRLVEVVRASAIREAVLIQGLPGERPVDVVL